MLAAPMRLEGRKALVTGGASGIGAAIAARLAAEGAEVWVGDINVEGAERVAGEIAGHALELDVTDLESAQAAVEAVGTPDILVNNAGTDEFGFFTYTTPEQWQRVLAINLGGVLNCTYAALPAMQQAGYGRIVSISSEAGRVGSKGSAVYSAAKGGVDRLHEGDRPRERPLRDHRQLDRPGPDRDAAADGRQGVRRDRREGDRDDEGRDPAAAASASPRRSPPRSPSSPPTTPPTSPARRSASAAASAWSDGARAGRAQRRLRRRALLTDVGGTIDSRRLDAMDDRDDGVRATASSRAPRGFEVGVKHVAAASRVRNALAALRLREVVDGRKLRFDVEVTRGSRRSASAPTSAA